jgi:hypothetical protein
MPHGNMPFLTNAVNTVLSVPSRRYTCRLPVKFHTRGFYECTAVLYHHARGSPPKQLFWAAVPGGRWRIDWQRMNRSAKTNAASV